MGGDVAEIVPSPPARRPRGLALLAALGAAAWLITPAAPSIDDAYIALASAQAFGHGLDAHYQTPALVGATSLPHVALLALLFRATPDPLVVYRLGAAASLTVAVLAVFALGWTVSRSRAAAAGLAALTIATPMLRFHLTNGLETGLVIAAVVGLLAAVTARRWGIATALIALLPWLRLDVAGVAVFGFLIVWRAAPAWRRRLAAAVVGAAAVMAATFLIATGQALPATMATKAAFFAEYCSSWRWRAGIWRDVLGVFARELAPWAIVGSAGALLVPRGRWLLLAIAPALVGYWLLFPGGIGHNGNRYLYATLAPWLIYGAAVAAARVPAGAAAALAALGLLIAAAPGQVQGDRDELRAVSAWLEQLPRPARVGVFDAGAPAVLTTLPLIDLVGLKSPAAAAVHRALTGPSCGRDRGLAVVEIAARAQLTHVVISAPWDAVFRLRDAFEAKAALVPLRAPAGHDHYRYTVYAVSWRQGR